ncbi:unnamed protein product [Nyctereutes procyonoides]|uniref:(raccoon dog) hypothetical protein n=1 Tax=Nyctereutes procyonoides TaxID=34880 RepID=A0A811YX42_NYCPR|nr:unnamed protein product [Nyctereutes procyonoides]
MGETQTTPLSLMLSHFSDVRERAHNLSTDKRRGKFQTCCMSEWPTFDEGWPQEGTSHLPIILQPTWEDCQQLSQVLFTTEERERIQGEARKSDSSLRAHEQVWPKLRAFYETGPPPETHRYRPGDWVYMRRHQQQTLQPPWKGPYIVILTTPTTLKVDGITSWVHYTHVRPADLHAVLKDFVPEWKNQPDKDNPLKLRLCHSHLPC